MADAEQLKQEKRQLILKVIETEWAFLTRVNNADGSCDCQEDRESFTLTRMAQFDNWTNEMLISYAADLVVFRQEGNNPLTAKFGYMMAYYDEAGYEKIKDMLPPVSPEAAALIEKIMRVQMDMTIEYYKRHPKMRDNMPPVFAIEDSVYSVSQETQLRGELCTYSVTTLQLYLDWIEGLKAEGQNLCEMTLNNTAKYFGFKNANEMESKLARR